jgi:hypothetical protein
MSSNSQVKSIALSIGMITASVGLIIGSILPGAPAFSGFLLGFIVGFGASAFVIIYSARRDEGSSATRQPPDIEDSKESNGHK